MDGRSHVRRLAEAVQRVHAGLRAIDPDLAAAVWVEAARLARRKGWL